MTVRKGQETTATGKVFRPHKYQSQVLRSKKRFIAAVAGIQSGKSTVGPVWLYNEIAKCGAEDGRYLVLSPSYKQMNRTALPELQNRWEGTDIEGVWKEQKKEYRLPQGGIVYFCSADKPDAIEGGAYDAIWMDEAGDYKRKVWVNVQARLSTTNGRCLLTSTPYRINWFYDEIYVPWKEGDENFDVIQWTSKDNPYFPNEEWERVKKSMDPNLFSMRYKGNFEQLGGLVYPDYRDNVVDKTQIEMDWPRYGAIDFGWSDPIAVLECALAPDGKVYLYREIKENQKLLKDVAHKLSKNFTYFGDPAAKREIEEMKSFGLNVESAENAIDFGIQKVTEYMRNGKLVIDKEACPQLLDELSTYQYDDKGDKPNDNCEDHLLDSMRYLITGISKQSGSKIYLV